MGRVTVSFTLSDEVAEWIRPFKSRSKFIDALLSEVFKDITYEELMHIIAMNRYQEEAVVKELIKRMLNSQGGGAHKPTTQEEKPVSLPRQKTQKQDLESWW